MRLLVLLALVSSCAAPRRAVVVGQDHRPYAAKPEYLLTNAQRRAAAARVPQRQLEPGANTPVIALPSEGGGSLTVSIPDPTPLPNRVDAPAQTWEPRINVPDQIPLSPAQQNAPVEAVEQPAAQAAPQSQAPANPIVR